MDGKKKQKLGRHDDLFLNMQPNLVISMMKVKVKVLIHPTSSAALANCVARAVESE